MQSTPGIAKFRNKLIAISKELTRWGNDTFGSVRKQIKRLKIELEQFQNDPATMGPSHTEIKLNERLVEMYHREELMWHQRS